MLEHCTKQAFAGQIGKTFSIRLGPDKTLVLEVIEVSNLDAEAARPFSVLLHGRGDGYLLQGTYELENEALGKTALFMVPLGPDPASGRMRYEIVFN